MCGEIGIVGIVLLAGIVLVLISPELLMIFMNYVKSDSFGGGKKR